MLFYARHRMSASVMYVDYATKLYVLKQLIRDPLPRSAAAAEVSKSGSLEDANDIMTTRAWVREPTSFPFI